MRRAPDRGRYVAALSATPRDGMRDNDDDGASNLTRPPPFRAVMPGE
jgi:hypothetical protein